MLERTFKIYKEYGGRVALTLLSRSLLNSLLSKKAKLPKSYYTIGGIPVVESIIDLTRIGLDSKIRMYVDPFDHGLSKDVFNYGIREPLHVLMLHKIIKALEPDLVADIGSNIGYFPLIELNAGAKRILCFEPNPLAYRYLRLNLNRFSSRVELFSKAISVNGGRLTLYMPIDSGMRLNLGRVDGAQKLVHSHIFSFKVQSLSISQLMKRYSPMMIRMDIEGYEWKLLSKSDLQGLELIDLEIHVFSDIMMMKKAIDNLIKHKFVKLILMKDFHPATPIDMLTIKYFGLKKALQFDEIFPKDLNKLILRRRVKLVDIRDLLKILIKVGLLHGILLSENSLDRLLRAKIDS